MDENTKSKWGPILSILFGSLIVLGIRATVGISLLAVGFFSVRIIMHHMGLNVTLNKWDLAFIDGVRMVKKILANKYKPEKGQFKQTEIFGGKTNVQQKKTAPFTFLNAIFSSFKGIFSGKDDRFRR